MICVHCGEATQAAPCGSCGREPRALSRFALQESIGRGATGTTFRAVDPDGDVVAVKEMPLGRASAGKDRELLEREVRVLSQLQHPGIPAFIASGIEGEGRGRALLLVQEYIEGVDLATELQTHRYSAAEVLVVLDGLLDVLVYLHDLSPAVVHRDLKPANVMRRPDGGIVLLDYGAVRDSLRELGGSTVAGTFGYMAPEQLIGDATPMSDLYALGALAVHLLSRVDPQQMLSVQRGLDWEPHLQVAPGVRALLHDLLEPDPDRRRASLHSTRAVQQRVRGLVLDPDAAPAPMVAVVPTAPPPVQTQQRMALITGVAVACFGAAVAMVLVAQDVAPPIPAEAPVVVQPPPPPPPVPVPPPVPDVPDPEEILEVALGDYPPRGPAEAPVQIVAFTDLQCPFCGRAADTIDELLQTREGLVSVWIRDFPLAMHQQARGAHIALRCADEQDAMWAMHDRLFDHRDALHHEDLLEHAGWLGLDVSEFGRCLDDDAERHEASIDRDIAEGSAHGVRGTPTFFVNGVLLSGAQPLQRFEEAVDAALERLQDR